MAPLEIVIELLAQTRRDLLQHLGGLDRRAHAAMDRKQHAELNEVGLDGGLHVRILQLGGERAAIVRSRAMHLAERGRRRGFMLEACELRFPIRSELRRHAPAHERPAHRRRLALELAKLGGIFGRQRFGNGGEQLRHLHDRAFQSAQRRGERGGILVALGIEPEQTPSGDARRHAADIGADLAVAERPRAQSILLLVGGAVVHGGTSLPSRVTKGPLHIGAPIPVYRPPRLLHAPARGTA